MKNENIDTAVILAAGKGERISNSDEFIAKPLIKVFDLSLIERSIKNLINNLNVKKIYIVTGFNHEEINDHLVKLKNKLRVNIYRTPDGIMQDQLKAWDVIVDKFNKTDPFFKKVVIRKKVMLKKLWHTYCLTRLIMEWLTDITLVIQQKQFKYLN